MEQFIQGLGAGLVLSFLIGPIFFMLIRVGIEHGFRYTMIYCSGVWFSDLLYILGTYFGISYVNKITHLQGFDFYAGLIGGILFLGFGIASFFARSKAPTGEEVKLAKASAVGLFIKGFVVNTFNPGTVFFWIALSTKTSQEKEWDISNVFIFYAGLYVMLICTDAYKALLARKIQQKLTPEILEKIRKLLGLVLIVCGLFIIFKLCFNETYVWMKNSIYSIF
jgi:threonine/homoserine/homoserine lactone efflux protein